MSVKQNKAICRKISDTYKIDNWRLASLSYAHCFNLYNSINEASPKSVVLLRTTANLNPVFWTRKSENSAKLAREDRNPLIENSQHFPATCGDFSSWCIRGAPQRKRRHYLCSLLLPRWQDRLFSAMPDQEGRSSHFHSKRKPRRKCSIARSIRKAYTQFRDFPINFQIGPKELFTLGPGWLCTIPLQDECACKTFVLDVTGTTMYEMDIIEDT